MPRTVIGHLREALLPPDGGRLTNGQLLGQFVAGGDQAAFAALVRRHGPMVLGVCRRVLRDAHDAEDAFQAAFLVLARKAATVADREAVAGWLHRVARRAALGARAMAQRRRAAEQRRASDTPRPDGADGVPSELLEALDRELARLPEKYRLAVVLCELEGRPRKDVARQLGVPDGTLSSRLAAARKRLARRLARFGPAASAAALGALLAEGAPAAVPAPLLGSAVKAAALAAAGQAAAGAVSAPAAALAEGVMRAMFLTKLRAAAWVILLAASVSAGAVGLSYRASAEGPQEPARPARGMAGVSRDELEALRLEVEALRRELRSTRERVRALEEDHRAVRDVGPGGVLHGRTVGEPVPRGLPEGAAGVGGPPPGGGFGRFGGVGGGGRPAPDPKPQPGAPGPGAAPPASAPKGGGPGGGVSPRNEALPRVSAPVDAVRQMEQLLDSLKITGGDPRAAEELERAIQRLKERPKPDAAPRR
jgi:RNA polymerase sigma factor (sigma-70 family)